MFDLGSLTRSVIVEGRSDAVFVRAHRDGFDERTVACLRLAMEKPEMAFLRLRVGERFATFEGLVAALEELTLSAPSTEISPHDLDVFWLAQYAASLDERGLGLARAILGLFALAVVEALAMKHRQSAFPWFSLNVIRRISLPTSQWLASCGASWSAGCLARFQREYLLSDPYQRGSAEGRSLAAELRLVEAESNRRLREGCQEVAWLLREDYNKYRIFVASLFFATGDGVRAFAIAGREQHKPSLRVLRDLVEVSVSLSTVDPLLQAVWLLTLGETKIPVPEDIRLTLRRVAPEILPEFKGADQGMRKHAGLSFSQAYALGVMHYLAGIWDRRILDETWWAVLKQAVELPVFQVYYRSGFLRILELVSLALAPGEALPSSEFVAGMAGYEAKRYTDIRMAASVSLEADQWTSKQAQLGRSIAYDSSFYIEPWRREESAEDSVNFLERHRFSGLVYWLTVVPPISNRPSKRNERRFVERDRALMSAYRSIAVLSSMEDLPVYLRVYGGPKFKKVLRVSDSSVTRYIMECDEEYAALRRAGSTEFPSYAEQRFPSAATIEDARRVIGIG